METCRLYAILSLLFLIPGAPAFPFAAAGCALAAGALVGSGLSRIRRRRITSFLVCAAGCAAFAFFSAGSYGGPSFWLVSCCVSLFWLRGLYMGGGRISHSLTVSRYDIGVGILLLVYFLRMGLREPDPLAPRLMGAYFLFSILALFFSRCRTRDNNFITARSAMRLLLPFAAVFFLAAFALVLVYPLLTRTAAEAYAFLRDNSGPLQNLLLIILRFLFGFGRRSRSEAASPEAPAGEGFAAGQEASPPGLFEKILMGGLFAALAAAALVLVIWLILILARYLAGRPAAGEEKPGLFAALRDFLAFLIRRLRETLHRLRRICARIYIRRRPRESAGQEAFRGLCAWGRVSGLPRRPSETPLEYLRRVAESFPAVRQAAGILTQGLQDELYGKKELSGKDAALLQKARRGLSSPALIPARLAFRLGLKK
jgi:hypothetical protein